jgi:integrase
MIEMSEQEPLEYLNKDELKKLFTVAANYGAREACMFILGYGHALRASEIANLKLSDIRGGKIACRRGKKSVHTTEVLRRHEIDALTNWLRERGEDASPYLFTSRQGDGLQPITRQQVYNLFRKVAELTGLREGRFNPHILKHSYASHMVRAGVNLAYIQRAMGHAHISSTTRYTHVTVSEAQAKSNAVVDAILAA